MEKKISVVIPTYKRPTLLFCCLRALAVQSLSPNDFEVIVVHDGPGGFEDLEPISEFHFEFLLTLCHTPVKRGPAAARNWGWLMAKYPVIAFTDDDCLPQPDWLYAILSRYRGEALICYTGRTIVPLAAEPSDFERNTAGLEQADFITANCACTKQALIATGGFDERFPIAWREDSDLEFSFLTQNIPILRNKEAVVVHPVRKASWGVSLKEQRKGIYDVLLFSKNPLLYRQRIQSTPIWNYYLICLSAILLLYAWIAGYQRIGHISALLLFAPITAFAYKRLKKTRHSPIHVLEMIITSALIPFLSVYWRIYGMIKFRKILF